MGLGNRRKGSLIRRLRLIRGNCRQIKVSPAIVIGRAHRILVIFRVSSSIMSSSKMYKKIIRLNKRIIGLKPKKKKTTTRHILHA